MVPIMLGYKSVILAEQKVSLSFQVAEERLQIRNSFEKCDVQLRSRDGGKKLHHTYASFYLWLYQG